MFDREIENSLTCFSDPFHRHILTRRAFLPIRTGGPRNAIQRISSTSLPFSSELRQQFLQTSRRREKNKNIWSVRWHDDDIGVPHCQWPLVSEELETKLIKSETVNTSCFYYLAIQIIGLTSIIRLWVNKKSVVTIQRTPSLLSLRFFIRNSDVLHD